MLCVRCSTDARQARARAHGTSARNLLTSCAAYVAGCAGGSKKIRNPLLTGDHGTIVQEKGLAFSSRSDYLRSPYSGRAEKVRSYRSSGRRCALIVDDDSPNPRLLSDLFRTRAVPWCTRATRAALRACPSPRSLVLVDTLCRGLNGVSFIISWRGTKRCVTARERPTGPRFDAGGTQAPRMLAGRS